MREGLGYIGGFYRKKQVVESQKITAGDCPGGPAVKTLCPQSRGHRFNSWSGK